MIELTRLNGNPMVLNSDLIKTAEASPDTMLTLINGEKLIVREEIAEVVDRVLAYRARLLAAWPGGYTISAISNVWPRWPVSMSRSSPPARPNPKSRQAPIGLRSVLSSSPAAAPAATARLAFAAWQSSAIRRRSWLSRA